MAKKVTFTMSVTYDDYEVGALAAIENAMLNIDGIYEWTSEELSVEDVEYEQE
ncbi:hypothetical protein [uncultured Planococcus sp.]|uniref:hypothetical protein n=1 Tax=uncultured Planococcus sp. TaxID=337815 RepID=UPI00260557A7|nr:hypothetical protein [uncultured Planococcus sp.]